MTSWMKERDRLLEQTLAFVQGVTGQRPIVVAPTDSIAPAEMPADIVPADIVPADIVPTDIVLATPPVGPIPSDAASIETDALISLMALSQSAPARDDHILPAEPIAVADSERPIRVAVKPPVHKPARERTIELVLPERDVIAQRVSRFRAGQQKLLQDREDQYAASQAKIRASLGNDPFG